jgi:hypothetical protein
MTDQERRLRDALARVDETGRPLPVIAYPMTRACRRGGKHAGGRTKRGA